MRWQGNQGLCSLDEFYVRVWDECFFINMPFFLDMNASLFIVKDFEKLGIRGLVS